jgi:hypothetical protein
MRLDTQLTALHGGLPSRTTFLLFSGHSDPRGSRSFMRAGIKVRQSGGGGGGGGAAATAYTGMTMGGSGRGGASVVQWRMADDRVLEEAVMCADGPICSLMSRCSLVRS